MAVRTLPVDMYKSFRQDSHDVIFFNLMLGQVDGYVAFSPQTQHKQATIHALRIVINTSQRTCHVNFCNEILI